MYIFGYGSLVNIKSAQKSFKRELQQEDFIPVVYYQLGGGGRLADR